MRRGNHSAIHRTPDGRLMAVDLGSDYCAEHERGIPELETVFGLDPKARPGIERRQIRELPEGLEFEATQRLLRYQPYTHRNGKAPKELERHPPLPWDSPEQVAEHAAAPIGAWSNADFGVAFPQDDQGSADAAELYAAFERRDIAFLFENVGDNPFARAGLVLAIVSRLPAEITANLAEVMADADALAKAVKASGIEERLRAAANWGSRQYDRRLGFYALTPRWRDSRRREVEFWLNPSDQEANHAGWFRVAELDAWIAGQGPVPKHPTSATCVECGQPIKDGPRRAGELTHGTCAACETWRELVTIRRENRSVRVAGTQYLLGDEPFGEMPYPGPKWIVYRLWDQRLTVAFTDTRTRVREQAQVTSTRLTRLGEIPAHFRARLPDNAVFVGAQPELTKQR
jgi:hypothetical protein